MKCPNCKHTQSYDRIQCLIPTVSSDGSYCVADLSCEKCGEELEFYYPLKEINGEAI